ncbi:MAG: exodeoxyribonuclease V subunit beta [Gammaproteobacteria bacterium]|nr:exodeoxyribonuclease V subunit beta [Gammaproteobacteria bacterium]
MSKQTLIALNFPLYGSRLIEASAGTGKTYTIAALYVRLVLNHGGQNAFRRDLQSGPGLMPPEILVVTFTDAATKELRDRIRARLVEAAQLFRGQLETEDAFLLGLQAEYAPEQWPACAFWLDSAAQWMDEAAVSTIHAWCKRMLGEHAFASGSLFNQELQKDHSALYEQVVKDYWRSQCYELTGPALQWVIEQWQTPQHLWGLLQPVLKSSAQNLPAHTGSLAQLISTRLTEHQQQLAELKQPWLRWVDELEALIEEAAKAKAFHANKMNSSHRGGWFTKLRAWAQDAEQLELNIGRGMERLTPEGLAEIWKEGSSPPEHPALYAMQELPAQLQALEHLLPDAMRWHAASWVQQCFSEEKNKRAELGFDDLLTRLDHALQADPEGRLAQIIRRQFPVVMIDEFQDTDPVQYRIFDSVYNLAANDPETGLFLIGDPKQAIYSFRGADIYSYLAARKATAGRHYNLDTNYRSTHAMVAAVNQLFARATSYPRGAFLFGAEGEDRLDYVQVKANGRATEWQVDGEKQPALTFWHLPADDKRLSKGYYSAAMAASCASEIVRLLNSADTGFVDAQGQLQPLQASDIAVLVRGIGEARDIRAALAERQVRSVYLSERDSVFNSQQAFDIQLWLAACLQPEDERAVKAALASQTLALSLNELENLQQDERLWEATVERFKGYQQRWQQRGVLPMLRKLMHDYQLPQRLVQDSQGERALTNLLHLAEILQQQARELDGQATLLQYLQHAYAVGEVADEQILRLESDANLVRVVTIHKSKGLEYPLVFLPFVSSYRPCDRKEAVVVQQDSARQLFLRAPDEQIWQQAEQERLAEDLRLLYVALTRSKHACWLSVAEVGAGLHGAALGYLLGGGQELDNPQALTQWLAPLTSPETQVLVAPQASHDRYQVVQAPFTPECRQASALTHKPWWISSYSRLSSQGPGSDWIPESLAAQVYSDDEAVLVEPAQVGEQKTEGMHAFPRGARHGNFLHDLLELCLSLEQQTVASRRALVETLCQQRGYTDQVDTLCQWLEVLLSTEFQLGDGHCFNLLQLEHWQAEMEFWFAAEQVESQQLDQLVSAAILAPLPRPQLNPLQLNGMFKGFIDLLFSVDGRYYVADYKSNHLGANSLAYTEQAMDAAVLKHRYDLQYVLYSLALHRLLRGRLPDYDYEQHFGGVVYLFLRGIEGPQQGVHYQRPPLELLGALDALFAGRQEVA